MLNFFLFDLCGEEIIVSGLPPPIKSLANFP